jgi:osmotically-inducible protein OsmY
VALSALSFRASFLHLEDVEGEITMCKRGSAFVFMLAVAFGVGSIACNRPSEISDRQAADEANTGSTAPVSDSWITTRIEAQYFADADVKGRHIDVTTVNGAVMLDGRVDSERARQRAVEIAQKTDGVNKVDDSLEVGPAPASSETSGITEQASRGWIITKVQAQYFADPDVKGRHIDVTTANGVVTLNGTVDSEMARQRAVEIARTTDGVRDVEDRLRIEVPGGPRTDSERADRTGQLSDDDIADRIEAKYYRDENVGANDIDVSANEGVVTLTGSVDTEGERRRAVMIARRSVGVRDVKDDLKVESRVATSGRSDKDTDVVNQIEDAWITTKIQSKFFIDDEVEGDIDVTTSKGVVTLGGEAQTPEARRQAEEIARETDGVTRVVNRLRVSAKRR